MGMKEFLVKRIFYTVIVLFSILTIIFYLFRAIPSDPVSLMIDSNLPIEAQERLRAEWGFDKPIFEQYMTYLAKFIRGDFGRSFYYRKPVQAVIGLPLFNTLLLVVPGVIIGSTLGIRIGTYAGWHRGSYFERFFITLVSIYRGIPGFWKCILALMVFSAWLGLVPSGGLRSPGREQTTLFAKYFSLDFLHHYILPLTMTILGFIPETAMLMRTSILEVRGEGFLDIITAKGVEENIVARHAVRNSLLPVITWIFHSFGRSIGGQVLLEVVFNWPGLGRELIRSVSTLDYPVAQATFFLIALVNVLGNLASDIAYGYLDPRVVYY